MNIDEEFESNLEIVDCDDGTIVFELSNDKYQDYLITVQVTDLNKNILECKMILKKMSIAKSRKLQLQSDKVDTIRISQVLEIDLVQYDEDLFQSIENDDIVSVMCAVENGADLNVCREDDGFYPIHCAVFYGNIEIVKYLVEIGSSINIKSNKLGLSPIHIASAQGFDNIAKYLIEKGVDINVKNTDSNITPLHFASYNGNFEIVKMLVSAGASLNERDADGCTPLYDAIDDGHFDICNYLIENGAYVNERDVDGYSPLHIACALGHIEMTKYFTDRSFMPHMEFFHKVSDGWGVVQVHKATSEKYARILKYLTSGIKTDEEMQDESEDESQDEAEQTQATQEDEEPFIYNTNPIEYLRIIDLLIEKGAIINSQDNDGYTALHIASILGYVDIVKILISKGVDINIQDNNGQDAMKVAQENSYFEIVGCLSFAKQGVNQNQ